MTNSVAMPLSAVPAPEEAVSTAPAGQGLWAYSPVDDRLHDECGVFGVFGHPDAARLTALGLHALQHRGQESAGIVSYDSGRFHSERQLGLVGDRRWRDEYTQHQHAGHNGHNFAECHLPHPQPFIPDEKSLVLLFRIHHAQSAHPKSCHAPFLPP